MNLLAKLLNHYSEEEIKNKIDKKNFLNILNNKNFTSLDIIAEKIDIKNIGYSLEDFQEDYPQYKKHKEIKTIYNIQIAGETIGGLGTKNNCTTLYGHIKDGFDYNSNDYIGKKEVLEFFDFDIDLSKFEIDTYKKHTELCGDKSDLEEFRNQFRITHPVHMNKDKNGWLLAFDGMLNDWIKEVYLNIKN